MTLNARSTPAFSIPPMPTPLPAPQMLRPVRPATELFGILVLEAVMPSTGSELPARPGWLPDWEIRVWPVARLGDVTLEARPLLPHLGADELRAALRAEGWTPLGPVRERRS